MTATMKTIDKLESLLSAHRARMTLLLLMLILLLYAFGCKRNAAPPASGADMAMWGTEAGYVDGAEAASVPEWVPAGADRRVRYYYLPEAEVYYDAFAGNYVYFEGGNWVVGTRLPHVYASVDLYTTPIIFLSIGVVRPWVRHEYYVTHYHRHLPRGWGFYGHGHPWRCFDENGKHGYPQHGYHVHHPYRGLGYGPTGHWKPKPVVGGPKSPHWKGGPAPKPGKMKGSGPSHGYPGPGGKHWGPSSGGGAGHDPGGQGGKGMSRQSKPMTGPISKGGSHDPGAFKPSQGGGTRGTGSMKPAQGGGSHGGGGQMTPKGGGQGGGSPLSGKGGGGHGKGK